MITRILPIVLVAALGAEEAATTPAPAVAPAPAPTPAPQPAAAPPAEAPAPATEPPAAGPATVAPAGHQVRGTRVARVADAAPWEATVRLSAGYDSNALLESNPDKSSADTAVYSAEAGLAWRPVADDRSYLKLGVSAGYDARPDLEDLDTTRVGGSIAGAHQAGSLTWGGSLVGNRYWIGGDGAAAELRGGGSLGWLRHDSADLLSLEAAVIHYDAAGDQPDTLGALADLGTADDRSGVLAAAGYRHWWLFAARNYRIEAGARAGRYFADADTETYTLVQPFVGARLRPGLWEINTRVSLDWRAYAGSVPGHDPERSTTLGGTFTADRRLERVRGLSAGVYGAAATRDSSLPERGYDRWQAGVRLTWNYSPEE